MDSSTSATFDEQLLFTMLYVLLFGWARLNSLSTATRRCSSAFIFAFSAGDTRMARDIDGGGSQVAVLCLNEALFDKIHVAGRVREKFVPITTREDLKELRYAKSKCVFSMPEFVAGLQFHTVFLIHANSADYDEDQGQGTRRRYVSRVYLGASRAARKILLSSSKEHGGPSQLLAAPLANGTLRRVS